MYYIKKKLGNGQKPPLIQSFHIYLERLKPTVTAVVEIEHHFDF